jgi:hypothetical protein
MINSKWTRTSSEIACNEKRQSGQKQHFIARVGLEL